MARVQKRRTENNEEAAAEGSVHTHVHAPQVTASFSDTQRKYLLMLDRC